ncbi:MAG: winged helix-turn-helix transcriptional regulator [Candidatus Omnitrophica bacterium]|nr:winged helix-turn-helix transcriptional regulator [Candidatus Omnitrophota bacterium]
MPRPRQGLGIFRQRTYPMLLEALFSSKVRVKLLKHILNHPTQKFYLRGLERELNESATPLRRELLRLEKTGLLYTEDEANVKYYVLNRQMPHYEALARLFDAPVPGGQLGAELGVHLGAEHGAQLGTEHPEPEVQPRPQVAKYLRRIALTLAAGVALAAAFNVGAVYLLWDRELDSPAAKALVESGEQVQVETASKPVPVPESIASVSEQSPTRGKRFKLEYGTWK